MFYLLDKDEIDIFGDCVCGLARLMQFNETVLEKY